MTETRPRVWLPSADDPEVKRLVEHLPPQAFLSSCTALVPAPPPVLPCHDVNGYYEALGLTPDATRKDLRDAYMRLVVWDREEPDKHAYRTQAFKVLYNPEDRAEYDALAEDEWWVDPWVEAELRRRVAERERQRNVSWDGFDPTRDQKFSEEFGTVDIGDPVALGSLGPREGGLSPLKRWQTEAVRAFARTGLLTQVAVVFCAAANQVGVVPHRHGLVFLIGPEHLSVETSEARQVAEDIIEEMIS